VGDLEGRTFTTSPIGAGKFESLSVCSAGAIGVTLKADAVLRCPGNVAGQSAMFLLQSGVRFVGRHVLMQLK
jgi:hypothetical protein